MSSAIPKMPPLTRQQVRSVDQAAIEQYGIAGVVLMENAGRGAAEIVDQVAPPGPIVILCGRGNNAGDGYVIARHLQLIGRTAVRLVSLVPLDSLAGDALANAQIARKSKLDLQVVTDAGQLDQAMESPATIVECLLGTGATGSPRGMFADAVRKANAADALRIAIDIPAGLDCDTGVANEPTLRADHTISFVAAKIGFGQHDAGHFVGQIHVVGIGAPRILLEQIAP